MPGVRRGLRAFAWVVALARSVSANAKPSPERLCVSRGGWCRCHCRAHRDVGPGERNVEFRVRHGHAMRCDEDGAGFDPTFGELWGCECSADSHLHRDKPSLRHER